MVTVRKRAKNVMDDIDLDAMNRQSAYYKKLKAMGVKKLRHLHMTTFKKTKWWCSPPRGVARHLLKEWLIRRLWIYFAVKNYHFPKGSEFRSMFVKRAKVVLMNKLELSTSYSDQVMAKKLQDSSWIDKEGIDKLSDVEVDQLLSRHGVNFADDIPMEQRRFALWELYNKPGSKTLKTKPSATDQKGEMQVAAKRPSARRSAKESTERGALKEYIIAHPGLTYADFMKKAGRKFPTTSSGSYNMTKSILRKEGWNIPLLGRGRYSSSIKDAPPATKRRKKSKKSSKKKSVKKSVKKSKKSKKKAKKRTKK